MKIDSTPPRVFERRALESAGVSLGVTMVVIRSKIPRLLECLSGGTGEG